MKKEELRVIPKKNYIILGVVILFTLFLVYYFYMWFDAYKETKINMPILDKYMDVINYNELEDYLIENPNTIIYVSVLEDEKIREFEKKFKVSLKSNEIEKEILYLDITDDIKDKNIKNDMESRYTINSQSITDVPSILVIEDGILKSIYSIEDNDYSIDEVKLFINNVYFSTEDDLNG